jgi:glycosyltransferase involved in cell wall biosynthesis
VLVGKLGWKFKDVLKRIEDSQFSDRVHRLGYVDYEDMPLLYNLAQVFTYPSLYEGFGLPVLEAMACGIPVVTSDTSSLPEIVGDAGILVPPRDVGALHDSIWRVLNDEILRTELSTAGMSRAAMYSWEETARKTYEVYRTVAREKRLDHE